MTLSQDNPFRARLTPEHRVALDAIRSRSIDRFGFDAFRMEDPPAADPPAADPPAADPPAADPPAADPPKGEKVEDLPEWAQSLIKTTRGEAAENRTKASAAEKKLTEQLDGIAKALGLKGEEKADPAKLQAQIDSATRQARESAIELAVYRKAGTHKGDPDALLDSRSFQAKVTELDPTAKDFADKVEAAIKDAVKDNPKLKAQAAGSSSADHGTGGTGETGKREPKPLDQAVAGHYGT